MNIDCNVSMKVILGQLQPFDEITASFKKAYFYYKFWIIGQVESKVAFFSYFHSSFSCLVLVRLGKVRVNE